MAAPVTVEPRAVPGLGGGTMTAEAAGWAEPPGPGEELAPEASSPGDGGVYGPTDGVRDGGSDASVGLEPAVGRGVAVDVGSGDSPAGPTTGTLGTLAGGIVADEPEGQAEAVGQAEPEDQAGLAVARELGIAGPMGPCASARSTT